MKTFSVRAVNLVLIVALLIGYNTVLTLRDKDDQIDSRPGKCQFI